MIYIQIFLVFLLGILLGMLVNYLAEVLPWRRKIVKPFCLQCGKEQALVNYFIWPRRCPSCGRRRVVRSLFIEIAFGLLAIWIWFFHPVRLGFWGSIVLIAYFILVTVIDIEHRLILHPVSIFGAGLGLLIGIYLHGVIATLLGGLVGFGSMLILYWLGELLIRLLAKFRGESIDDVALGFGDVNLSGIIGLMLGFPAVVLGLFVAVMAGGIVSLVYLLLMLLLRKYRLFTALPYGPFLIIGAVILLFFSDWLASLF